MELKLVLISAISILGRDDLKQVTRILIVIICTLNTVELKRSCEVKVRYTTVQFCKTPSKRFRIQHQMLNDGTVSRRNSRRELYTYASLDLHRVKYVITWASGCVGVHFTPYISSGHSSIIYLSNNLL